jgi:hypothetical protein
MTVLGDPIIAPGPGLPDLHLIFRTDDLSQQTLLYIPRTEEPALAMDVFRIDSLQRSALDLRAIMQYWLTHYQEFARPSLVKVGLIRLAELELLFHAGFTDNPFLGDHQCAVRYVRTDEHDYILQFIRKRHGIGQHVLLERVEFISECGVGPEIFASRNPAYSDFAVSVKAHSTWFADQFLMKPSAVRDLRLEDLGNMLARCSPFDNPLAWANLSRYYATAALNDGELEEFDRAIECISCAVMNFTDHRADPVIAELLRSAADSLAELLMYTYGDLRSDNIRRAKTLNAALADGWRASDPDKALTHDLMVGLAELLSQSESHLSVDFGLSPSAREALKSKDRALEAFDTLHGYSLRMAHIARAQNHSLYNDAILAADLAQVVIERAHIDGKFDLAEYVGLLAQAIRDQINGQLGFYGLTQDQLDLRAKLFNTMFREAGTRASTVAFLRPLATTSRRLFLRNEFLTYDDSLSPLVPARISLEAALHLAFVRRFRTIALGGPIDIFGMARPTATGGKSSDALASWQTAAVGLIQTSDAILVLLAESEGLGWEMSEIARQGVFGKVVFVLPPGASSQQNKSVEPFAYRLRQLGFGLPGELRKAEFLLIGATGAVERTLEFQTLWTGELLEAVWSRVRKKRG